MGPSRGSPSLRGPHDRPSDPVAVRFECLKFKPQDCEISFSYRTSPASACDCHRRIWTVLDGVGRQLAPKEVPMVIEFWTAWTVWTALSLKRKKEGIERVVGSTSRGCE
jgi:hypothetical protein